MPTQDAKVAYLTNDHLGSPRIDTDANGAVTSRHDYRPFGEEIITSQRTAGLGYAADTVRKQFTGYERDNETNLDFAEARYFGSSLGRFTSPDPLAASAHTAIPQSWNRYSYSLNNPLSISDRTGMSPEWVQKDGEVFYDSRVVDQQSATEIYGDGAKYRPNGDQYTSSTGTKVELGDLGFFKEDGVINTNGDRAEASVNLESAKLPGKILQGGLSLAGGLALDDVTGVGVSDDAAIPPVIVGTLATALVVKMAQEISKIQTKPAGPQGVQYALRATTTGDYACYTCLTGTMNLNQNDVWKYGETTNPTGRYSQTGLDDLRVRQVNEFSGSQVEIKVAEKVKIYGYFATHGHLPPGNKIFR